MVDWSNTTYSKEIVSGSCAKIVWMNFVNAPGHSRVFPYSLGEAGLGAYALI